MMKKLLGPSGLVWSGLVVIYALFWVWYTGPGGALTPEDIDRLMARVEAEASSDPGLVKRMRSFAENDDGGPFYVVNLVRGGGLEAGGRPEVDRRAGLGQLRKLLSRAGHPVAGGAIETNLMVQGVSGGEATPWDRVVLVRYRSRRDFLEVIKSEAFAEHARQNAPLFDQTIKAVALPTPGLAVGPRGVLFFLLVIVGLSAQLVLSRRRALAPPGVRKDRIVPEPATRISGLLPTTWGRAFAFAGSLLWRTAVLAFLPTALVAVATRGWTGPIVIVEQLLRLSVALSALALASRWLFRGHSLEVVPSSIKGG